MLLLHVSNAVGYAFTTSWAPTFYIASTFLNPLMAIAVSRFHLTLRMMAYELDNTIDGKSLSLGPLREDEKTPLQPSTLRFAPLTVDVEEHLGNRSYSECSDERWVDDDQYAENEEALLDDTETTLLCMEGRGRLSTDLLTDSPMTRV